MKSVMGLFLGLAALAPAVSFATELTAEQILAKVSQTYCGLRSFRLVERQESQPAVSTSHLQTAQDLPAPFGTRPARCETDLAVSTPGKIRLVVSSGQAEILLVSDGRETWAYIPNLNEYVEATAAPLLQELWAHPIGFISDDLALYRSLTHQHGHAKLRGEEMLSLGGQELRCYVVEVPDPVGSRRLWVDEERFIVLQDEWISPPGSGPDFAHPNRSYFVGWGTWTSRLTKANLGPISSDVFQFVVPSGARQVESFSPPAGPVKYAEEMLEGRLTGSEMGPVAQKTEEPLLGSKAHDFTARGLDGRNVRLEELRGKIVVLDFWASWCKPCQEELEAIQKLHGELASRRVVFLGIDDESSETVQEFVKAHRYTFPILSDWKQTADELYRLRWVPPGGGFGGYPLPMVQDSKQTLHELYGVRWVPTTVVIDRKGKIAAHYVGGSSEAQLRQALKSAGLNTTP